MTKSCWLDTLCDNLFEDKKDDLEEVFRYKANYTDFRGLFINASKKSSKVGFTTANGELNILIKTNNGENNIKIDVDSSVAEISGKTDVMLLNTINSMRFNNVFDLVLYRDHIGLSFAHETYSIVFHWLYYKEGSEDEQKYVDDIEGLTLSEKPKTRKRGPKKSTIVNPTVLDYM
jgi:hypothetical protein